MDLRCQLDPPSPVWSPCSSQVIWIPTWHASIHIWILPTWLVLGWFLYLSKHFGSLHVHWYHSIVIVVLCSVPIALWLFFLPVVLRGTEHTHGGHMQVGSCALCASLSRPIKLLSDLLALGFAYPACLGMVLGTLPCRGAFRLHTSVWLQTDRDLLSSLSV